ncbi:MAG: ribbon-helix-helix protein, CopG family [Terracidiphilus sp.]|nr:ribbon-helix-helix protein, CopG family [Terracidiphilus sp.]
MAIARNPKRNQTAVTEDQARAFISGSRSAIEIPEEEQNKKPIMIRVDPKMLDRIDHAAKRLGISRSAFIASSAAVRVESME